MCEKRSCIGHVVHRLSRQMKRMVDYQMKQKGIDSVTAMHGWVLGYLYENKGKDVYQKDLEQQFCITRSAVTNIVQHMEDKGYIRREAVKRDARLKKLVLTQLGEQIHIRAMEAFDEAEHCLAKCLTQEETIQFYGISQKLIHQIQETVEENFGKKEKGE